MTLPKPPHFLMKGAPSASTPESEIDHPTSRISYVATAASPHIIPREQHNLSRRDVSPNALRVLNRLHEAGYRACLVGGGVRDLLLGRRPKDFDVCTDAHPEAIYKLFRNCRLIGRRFRLAHIQFGPEIIEVATFRASRFLPEVETDGDEPPPPRRTAVPLTTPQGRILDDNVYGNIDQDAQRRDFTVNALYYDIANCSVLDYAHGMADLQAGVLRMIGDPEVRYREDPVRMLRAVRFAAKLGFRIDAVTEQPIHRLGHLLRDVPAARLFDETLKLFMSGHGVTSFEWLRLYGLFEVLFPATHACLNRESGRTYRTLLRKILENTDLRVAQDKPVSPAFLFAGLLWPPYIEECQRLLAKGMLPFDAEHRAAHRVLNQQSQQVALPKRFSLLLQEIWYAQPRFHQRNGKHPQRLVSLPIFRAAYDFLVLRAQVDPALEDLANWWGHLQLPESANPDLQDNELSSPLPSVGSRPASRTRRRPRQAPPKGFPKNDE